MSQRLELPVLNYGPDEGPQLANVVLWLRRCDSNTTRPHGSLTALTFRTISEIRGIRDNEIAVPRIAALSERPRRA